MAPKVSQHIGHYESKSFLGVFYDHCQQKKQVKIAIVRKIFFNNDWGISYG